MPFLTNPRCPIAFGLLTAAFLSACAPTQTDQVSNEAPTASGETNGGEPLRTSTAAESSDFTGLVVYRTSFAGLAVQPKVFVNGQQAAVCAPGRATSVQLPPGTYRVSAQTLSEKETTVTVNEGKTTYVKCSITIGLVVGGVRLDVVDPVEARPKVAGLTQK